MMSVENERKRMKTNDQSLETVNAIKFINMCIMGGLEGRRERRIKTV